MDNMENLDINNSAESEVSFSYNAFVQHVSGMDPTDSGFEDFLINKRDEIRNSYNLPSRDDVGSGKMSVEGYTTKLKEIASNEGITVSYDLEKHIEETPELKASVLNQKAVSGAFENEIENVNKQKTIYLKNRFNFAKIDDINTFEHELIHALQYTRDPQMPIERKELEAYLCTASKDLLRKENLRDMMFSLMKGSIESHYNQNRRPFPWLKKQETK